MARAWPALDIHVPGCDPELHDLVLAELDDFQPTAIQEPDEAQTLRAFFTSAASRDAAAAALGAAFGSHVFVEPMEVEDEDWAARSQAALRAVTVGRLTIAPPWDAKMGSDPLFTEIVKRGSDPIFIVIQPSMGFGTGHHATTRLMLKALQTLELGDRTVLDIGCGSGVLGIAAVRLGASQALCLDIDPDALQSAAENVALNNVADRVGVQLDDFRDLAVPAPIILANLTGALLEQSAPRLAQLVEPGGSLVVSGFMDSETAVVPSLQKFLTLQNIDGEDEWRCAVFRRSASVDRQ